MEKTYFEDQVFSNITQKDRALEHLQFVDCQFKDCVLEECKIVGCMFVGCMFVGCEFVGCSVISPIVRYSEMKNSAFIGCNLIGVHWNQLLSQGRLAEPLYQLQDCVLKYNSFVGMNLKKMDFSHNVMLQSSVDECNLWESKWVGCDLEGTRFERCDLRRADFREAGGYVIDVISNRLDDAQFSFPQVMGLLQSLPIKIGGNGPSEYRNRG